MIWPRLITLVVIFGLAPAPEITNAVSPDLDAIVAERGRGAVVEMDPRAMIALEQRGLSLPRLFDASRRTNDALAETKLFDSIVQTLNTDLQELSERPSIGEDPAPNRPFRISWLRDARARFELTGVVHRLDRRFVAGCGEARLIYRLVLEPEGRPPTELPMTVNVIFQQRGDGKDCGAAARAWTALPTGGRARVEGIVSIVRALGPFVKVETNLQNLHGPALRSGEDDHAEYLLRSFERDGETLIAKPLLDTPRDDVDRNALAEWIRAHFQEIDAGSFVVPEHFLAMRAVSVAPRGAARRRNGVFSRLFEAERFADLPYARAAIVKSPQGLLRRLDEATCMGCHETRAIAGFHLLGEDRDPDKRFNALAVGRSAHFDGELDWRAAMVASAAIGVDYTVPRPFAERAAGSGSEPRASNEKERASNEKERAAVGPAQIGASCSLTADDPTTAGWTCAVGLRCRDTNGASLGTCVASDGNHEGDPCEDVHIVPAEGPDGDRIVASRKEGCTFAGPDACSPNHFGFPGGMCSDACTELGRAGPETVCTDLPAAGYESDCFPRRVPIETCLLTHSARRKVRFCDVAHPCRDDFACARVPGLPPQEGACVPPYFVFQARVDGPVLDR